MNALERIFEMTALQELWEQPGIILMIAIAVFLLYLGTLMVPGVVTLLPNYVILKSLDWLDSFQALIIPADLVG